MMSHRFAIGCLLAVVLIASPSLAAGQPRELLLFDFETDDGVLNLGGEFPGAEGHFALAEAAAAHDGKRGGRLSFDLTKGAYVAWEFDLPKPVIEGGRSFSAWVRTDAAGRRMHCKTRDATGQEHLRYATALPAGKWQRVRFDIEKIEEHWNGANDGKIHWPITLRSDWRRGGPRQNRHASTSTRSRSPRPPRSTSTRMQSRSSRRDSAISLPPTRRRRSVGRRALLDATPRQYAGTWRVVDWQENEAAHGEVATGQPLTLPRLPAGAFRLELDLHDTGDAAIALRGSAWFGVLSGPNPPPCSWVGTVTHGGHGWGRGDLRYLDLLNAAGIGVVRDEFAWASIETTKGQYATSPAMDAYVDGLKQHGIKLNLLLTYGNGIYANPLDPDAFARWAGWMAQHYREQVQ